MGAGEHCRRGDRGAVKWGRVEGPLGAVFPISYQCFLHREPGREPVAPGFPSAGLTVGFATAAGGGVVGGKLGEFFMLHLNSILMGGGSLDGPRAPRSHGWWVVGGRVVRGTCRF